MKDEAHKSDFNSDFNMCLSHSGSQVKPLRLSFILPPSSFILRPPPRLALPADYSCRLILDLRAGVLHLCDRLFTIARFHLDSAHRIFQCFNLEALS